ncbi:MAG: glucose-6-phosphate isomerase [Gammaproteobacteria bacterium]|nr:glucose-6-phosphate isomerase [Gammaproteobacteria bacterium]
MPEWDVLAKHAAEAREWRLDELLDAPGRFGDFSLRCDAPRGAALLLDFSRQRLSGETPRFLRTLAEARGLYAARAALFAGEVVNPSENRAALHPDARSANPANALLAEQRERVGAFARRFRAGEVLGAGDKPLKRIVNIGIGGSDLGVRLLCSALGNEHSRPVDFVAELDGVELERALSRSDPAETLFVVCSKSFSTAETLANAYSARHWLTAALGEDAPGRHFAAVSANAEAMAAWGIERDRAFPMPDAVGGRYSVWSAAGLSAWLSLGSACMNEFLDGGRWLDRHFMEAPPQKNMPVLMGLLAFWNQSLLGCSAQLLLPYDTRLKWLPAYLQQLEMESLGKSADAHGRPLEGKGVAALFGVTGSSAQHSILQWAQQGARASSADFIAVRDAGGAYPRMHSEALRQMLAQAEALARGLPQSAIDSDPLAAHKALPGGRSSNILLLERLDPRHLGALIALYEHKVFIQATLLGVNPFDQWGVEHAKRLAADPRSQPALGKLLDD